MAGMSEGELFFGYSETLGRDMRPAPLPDRVERCACGGLIQAPPNDAARICHAVERHNGTTRHLAWRFLMPPCPTVEVAVVTCPADDDASGTAASDSVDNPLGAVDGAVEESST